MDVRDINTEKLSRPRAIVQTREVLRTLLPAAFDLLLIHNSRLDSTTRNGKSSVLD